MADKTYICNDALIKLGALPILDLDSDTSKKGLILRTVYEEALKLALADHPWKFATRRATLAEDATPPAFGFAHAFIPPTGNLRILGLCGDEGEVDPILFFKMEGGRLLTNESIAKVKYIFSVTDEGAFSPGFVMAFAYYLAALSAYGITGNGSLRTAIMQEYTSIGLPKAKSLDSQEATPEVYESNPWIESRL